MSEAEIRNSLLRLVRLMTDEGLSAFKADFDMAPTATRDEVVSAVREFPNYDAIRAFIRVPT